MMLKKTSSLFVRNATAESIQNDFAFPELTAELHPPETLKHRWPQNNQMRILGSNRLGSSFLSRHPDLCEYEYSRCH